VPRVRTEVLFEVQVQEMWNGILHEMPRWLLPNLRKHAEDDELVGPDPPAPFLAGPHLQQEHPCCRNPRSDVLPISRFNCDLVNREHFNSVSWRVF